MKIFLGTPLNQIVELLVTGILIETKVLTKMLVVKINGLKLE